MNFATRVSCGLLLLSLAGCATVPSRATYTSVATTHTPRVLRPLPNQALEIDTSGTVGPRRASSAMNRGFGEYDSHLQSSLYLCAGTGPAAGPCLAVLGGLFALAGATSSLVYGAAEGEGERDRIATSVTQATVANLPAMVDLSARIATTAAARAESEGRSLVVTREDCAASVADLPAAPAFELDIVHLKLDFTPGYQFRLTLVARVTDACRDLAVRAQRLAYLGPTVTLPKEPSRAAQAFEQALDAAVIALGPEVDLYLQGKRPPIKP